MALGRNLPRIFESINRAKAQNKTGNIMTKKIETKNGKYATTPHKTIGEIVKLAPDEIRGESLAAKFAAGWQKSIAAGSVRGGQS